VLAPSAQPYRPNDLVRLSHDAAREIPISDRSPSSPIRPNWISPTDQSPKATATRYLQMLSDGTETLVRTAIALSDHDFVSNTTQFENHWGRPIGPRALPRLPPESPSRGLCPIGKLV
jgi:hypothetical protein